MAEEATLIDPYASVADVGSQWWRRITPARVVLGATWLVVALGAGLRIRQWSAGRSFWLDEILLLRAMGEQRFGQLLEPLNLSQSAPPGWLAIQHVVVGLSGGDERWSRLLPLLLGIGALVVTVPLARLLLGGPAALAATALVAVSPPLIRYSDEFKQYSSDAFWVPLVLLAGCRFALTDQRRRRDWAFLAGSTALAVWFSHAGTLVAAGVLAALGLVTVARRRWRELLPLAAAAGPFAAGLAVDWVTLLSRNTDNAVLRDYWAAAFPEPGPVTWPVALDWLAGRATSVATNPVGLRYGWPLLVLLLAGLLVLGLRRPAALPVLLLPVAVVAAAGLARSYPIANRLALWLVPMVAVVVAATVDLPALVAGTVARPRLVRVPAVALAALLSLAALSTLAVLVRPQASTTLTYLRHPRTQEDIRTVLAALAPQRRPGDLILIDGRSAGWGVGFYGPRFDLGPVQAIVGAPSAPACAGEPVGEQLRESGAYPRVWLVVVHTLPPDQRLYQAQLATFGPLRTRIGAVGAQADLYVRSPAPMPAPDPPPRHCARIVPAVLS
ncbi:MAG TPA: glycosyltransferase family 39 protein [Mycobacteriales bacterium]|nr:glycosyltransferase family 39 protein [Mycobacteriales bacterium]